MMSFQHFISTVLLVVLATHGISGLKSTVGEYFQSSTTYPDNGRGIFLFGNTRLGTGVAYEFSVYVVHMSPVWLQIWRPNGNEEYKLIGQVRFNPQAVNERYEVSLYPNNYIFTQEGDILGIFNEEVTCPIAYRFNTASFTPFMYHSTEEGAGMQTGDSFVMQQLTMPYQFSVTVSYDTDVGPYLNPSPGASTSTEASTQQPTGIPNIPPSRGSIVYAGNGLHGKVTSISQSARGMYLLPHIKLPSAVIVSFFAYFVTTEPVCFQVLRPLSGEETYQLVGQVCHAPQKAPTLQEVTLGMGQYIFSEEGDQLGYLNQAYTGSIGFAFLTSAFTQGPWTSGYVGEPPQLWDSITYEQIGLPYDFAIGLRYDTVIDNNKYGYPPTLPPTTTTTTVTSTSTTSKVSPTVPVITEKIVGMDYLQRADKHITTAARRTFLMRDLCFPTPGLVTSFLFFPLAAGVIDMQVWRLEENETVKYELIGNKRIEVKEQYNEFRQIALEQDEEIQVQKGDCLGFSTMNDTGIIGYVFEEVRLSFAEQYANLENGVVLTFDSIPFPYKFAIAATYKDLSAVTSTDNPAVQTTIASSTTTTKKPNVAAVADNQDGPEWLYDSRFLLTMFIWLVVLTALFLTLCCYVTCCRSKQERNAIKEAQRNSYLYGYPEILRNHSINSSRPNSKYGQMRANDVIDYFNPTIGSHPGIRRDDSMKKPLTREDSSASSYNGYMGSSGNMSSSVNQLEVREGPYTVL